MPYCITTNVYITLSSHVTIYMCTIYLVLIIQLYTIIYMYTGSIAMAAYSLTFNLGFATSQLCESFSVAAQVYRVCV